ncbi:MAG: DUF1343 domain-containing protein [Desulfobacterales bacterium]|jgi:uncharacterized protein YbbC (DUF1343 family)
MGKVQTGLERLIKAPPNWLKQKRIGLLSNPASVTSQLCHARIVVDQCFPGKLKALYSPQHGFFAEKQDNMIESDHTIDPVLNLPVYSLYGQTRIPTAEMLDFIDVLIVDLQDVGTRVYTFICTASNCMQAAKRYDKKVVILDRPNPIGGLQIEGNCLAADCESFVGRYPIPMRYGLTIGEFCSLINDHFGIGCNLDVIPMNGWKRSMYFQETGLPWVAPSPNLPTPNSAIVYPGQVLWEGTNVSEGRGTTQPFELFGAPYFDTRKLLSTLAEKISGAILRPVVFEPTSNKWQGQPCNGFQIHVLNPLAFSPYTSSLSFLQAVVHHHKDQFQWKSPPYEYEFTRLPIDLIIGDSTVRQRLENRESVDDIVMTWQTDLDEFREISRKYYLYS